MANEKRLIGANGSFTLNATDNTGYSLCFGGGIISVMDSWGHCECEFLADDAPTVDAVEVVHGRWEQCFEDWRHQIEGNQCSACGFQHYGCGIRHYHYCPNCGAKMDGERKTK